MTKKYTVKEVAELYKVQPNMVFAWIKSGVLKAVDVGQGVRIPRWRISEDALKEFEKNRLASPLPPVTKRRRKKKETAGPYPTR